MIKHFINPQDDRYLFLSCDDKKEIHALQEYLNKIPQFQFLPSYKGIPKPEVHLQSFEKNGKKYWYCFSGLYLEVLYWCRKNGVQTTITDDIFKKEPLHTLDEFREIISMWGLSLDPYDYQIECAYNILSYKQSLSEIATRAGKTLIAYIIFRYMMHCCGAKKILMIVPSITLVKQGFEDFNSYAEFFKTETVWAKGRKEFVESSNLVIGTFQSLVKRCTKGDPKYNPHYFDQFDVVCVDEVHNAKAESIKQILSQPFMKFIKMKFGFSGTLPLQGTLESFSVQELMGGKIQEITPRELMDGGFISDIHITQYRLKYPELEKSSQLRNTYIRCGEYLCSNFEEDEKKNHILLPKEERDICMVHRKKLPYVFKQLRDKIDKSSNFMERSNNEQIYLDYIIDSCKASGSNLLMLENYVSHHSQKKLNTIINIVEKNDGNGILFFHFNEYCKKVYEILKERFPDKKVLCMTGATTPKKREEYKKMMKERDDVVLCANYGVSSTGLTLRLNWGVFVESFKSIIINVQSIGRGLCLDNTKDHFELYDIIDCLPTDSLRMHGIHKCKLYKQEEFPFSVENL